MTLNLARVRHYLKEFRWDKLFFEEMGWDRSSGELSVTVAKQDYTLRSLAQKRGVQIFECQPDSAGKVPEYDVRRKIEKAVAKSAHEHLIHLHRCPEIKPDLAVGCASPGSQSRTASTHSAPPLNPVTP